MYNRTYTQSNLRLILMFFLILTSFFCSKESEATRNEIILEKPEVKSISHISNMSNLEEIVEQWGRLTAGENFKWVELYRGARGRRLRDKKIDIKYDSKSTKYFYEEQKNKKTQNFTTFGETCTNELATPSVSKVSKTIKYNNIFRWLVTKGISVSMPITATLPVIPVGVSIIPTVSFSSTKEGTSNLEDTTYYEKTFTIPGRTKANIELVIAQNEYEIPFDCDLRLGGFIVLCSRNKVQGNIRIPPQGQTTVSSPQGDQENYVTQQETLPFLPEEEDLLNIEKDYSHFPNLDDKELKQIQNQIESKYESVFTPIIEESKESVLETKESFGNHSKPRTVNWFERLLKLYKFESFPISTVIQEFLTQNPSHPANQNFIIDNDEIIFKAKGIISGVGNIKVESFIRGGSNQQE